MDVFLWNSTIGFDPGQGPAVGEKVKMNPISFDAHHLLKLRPETQPHKEMQGVPELPLKPSLIEPVRATLNECLKPIPGITNCWVDVKYYHDP